MMPLMLLFQVNIRTPLFVFLLRFVWSEPAVYILLYILRSLWVQEHTNVVSLCLFLTSDLCASGCLFLCAFHVLPPFCFLREGHAVVGFLSFGRRVFSAPRPSRGVICLVRMVTERRQEMNLLYHPTPLPFLVPGVYPSEIKPSPVRPYLHLSPPRPLRVDVAVPVFLQQGAGSHLQQRLIDLIMQF